VLISFYNLILTIKKNLAIKKLTQNELKEEIKKIDNSVKNGVITISDFNSYKENIYNISKEHLSFDQTQYLRHNLFEKTNDKQIDYVNNLIGLSGTTTTVISNINFNN
jgi:hypothetical protein